VTPSAEKILTAAYKARANVSDLQRIAFDWRMSWLTKAHAHQIEPEGDWWTIWLLLAGRGAGKTRTALIIAEVLADGGKVLVIDTEKESALTYADDFEFEHLRWMPPFEPRELARTLIEAGGTYDVVIVDSMSHFWTGDGGVLDIADGKYTGWKDARPAQADLVDGVLACDAHVILCVRSKVAHEQAQEGGKWVVRKLGMAPITDAELEYEINVACTMETDHSLAVSKSRTTAVPVGRTFKAGHAAEFAEVYRDWLAAGEPVADSKVTAGLKARMDALPEAQRKACKGEFMAQLGRPDHLALSKVPDAEALVKGWEAVAADLPADGEEVEA